MTRFWPAAVIVVTSACAGTPHPDRACMPIEDGDFRESVEGLAGVYELTMTASTGDRAGRSVTGRLELRASADERRTMRDIDGSEAPDVEVPYFGATDVPLDSVGAMRLGETWLFDERAPGVLFLSRVDGTSGSVVSATVRLGAQANDRDRVRFDGGYTVLRVLHRVGGDFFGHWESGVTSVQAGGHFCAFRVGG